MGRRRWLRWLAPVQARPLDAFRAGLERLLLVWLVLLCTVAFCWPGWTAGLGGSALFDPFLASKGWRRGWGTGAMFLILVVSAGTFVGLMIPLIIDHKAYSHVGASNVR